MFGVGAKTLAVWFGILVLAVANGALREAVLIPELGITPALILSGLILSILILLVAYFLLPWIGARRLPEVIAVGVGWLTLTLVFEFSFGLIRGKSAVELFEAYIFKDGNIWPLVLLITAFAPFVVAKLRRWL